MSTARLAVLTLERVRGSRVENASDHCQCENKRCHKKNLQRRKGNTKSSACDDMQRRNDQSSSQESRGRNIAAIVPDRLGSGPSRSTEKKRRSLRRSSASQLDER